MESNGSKQKGELKRVGSSWFVRYYLDGKRRMTKLASLADYATEKTIYPKFQEFMANVNTPEEDRPAEFRPNQQVTVRQFVTGFLKEHADSVRPNTLRGYHTVWDTHVDKRIGSRKLTSVRTHDVDTMLRSIAAANPEMREKTLARVKSFVHLVFSEASRKDLYDKKNPAAEAKAVAKNKTVKETGVYTDAEAQAIIDCLPEPYSVIFAVCYWTALRRSEVLALKWSDYGSEIFVNRSLGFGLKGEMVISNPKTSESQAPVHVASQLRVILNRWKMSQTKKLGDSKAAVNDCWIFQASESRVRRDGKDYGDLLDAAGMPPMQPSNILRVVLPKLTAKKLAWKGWHGFRRGVATELHRNGVSDLVIQKALRHANVSVTQESYIQTVPEVVIDAMGVLAKKRSGKAQPIAVSQRGTA
ncbi:MAG TPA: tyrosine-type recombinase/integrase [Verrucomicrobiae bacterium]|jgi:integrase|nr:tyrosine-type recombinase/integrase [Verrucomicrobiae bacterium]